MVDWDSAVKQSNRILYRIGNKGKGKKTLTGCRKTVGFL